MIIGSGDFLSAQICLTMQTQDTLYQITHKTAPSIYTIHCDVAAIRCKCYIAHIQQTVIYRAYQTSKSGICTAVHICGRHGYIFYFHIALLRYFTNHSAIRRTHLTAAGRYHMNEWITLAFYCQGTCQILCLITADQSAKIGNCPRYLYVDAVCWIL